MAHPLLAVPVVTTNPLGWAILGSAGYLAYKAGKKAGKAAEEGVDQPSLADRAVKGVMKTAYKAKTKIDDSLSNTREKYSEMWHEARTEVAE